VSVRALLRRPQHPEGKPIPVYRTEGERVRTVAALLNCAAALTNVAVAVTILVERHP
jgi:hypothetical protein